MGIGDWGLGIGDWGLGPIPNPQSPIPNPQQINNINSYSLLYCFLNQLLHYTIKKILLEYIPNNILNINSFLYSYLFMVL